MKLNKYLLWSIILPAAAAFTGCKADEGTEPGTDSTPVVTVYTYAPELPYNADNDVTVRFATNSATKEVYYIAEKSAEAQAQINANESAYIDHVISAGKKLEGVNGAGNFDIVITDLYGEYLLTAVAVNGSTRTKFTATFTGLEWSDVCSGTYQFRILGGNGNIPQNNITTLQICTTDKTLYRLKDVFGEGYSMKLQLMSNTGTDADGDKYTLFRVGNTPTPFTIGDYGAVTVSDIATWQGSTSWATNSNYMCYMYEDGYCVIRLAYSVDAGTLAYGQQSKSDLFIPNN